MADNLDRVGYKITSVAFNSATQTDIADFQLAERLVDLILRNAASLYPEKRVDIYHEMEGSISTYGPNVDWTIGAKTSIVVSYVTNGGAKTLTVGPFRLISIEHQGQGDQQAITRYTFQGQFTAADKAHTVSA